MTHREKFPQGETGPLRSPEEVPGGAYALAFDALGKVEAGLYKMETDETSGMVTIRDDKEKTILFIPISQYESLREMNEKREENMLRIRELKRSRGEKEVDH